MEHSELPDETDPSLVQEAPRILLHFFDHEIRKYHRRPVPISRAKMRRDQRFCLRLGVLACSEFVAIPASSYFETPDTREAINSLPAFVESGWIRLFGRTRSLAGFRDHKQSQYVDTASRHPVYFSRHPLPGERRLESAWIVKDQSTTDAITEHWSSAIEANDPWVRSVLGSLQSVGDPERVLGDMPNLLAGRAFISDAIVDTLKKALPRSELSGVRTPIDVFIAQQYLRTNLLDLQGLAMSGLPLIYDDILPVGVLSLAVGRWLRLYRWLGLDVALLDGADDGTLLQLRHLVEWDAIARDLARRAVRRGPYYSTHETLALRKAAIGQAGAERARTATELQRACYRYLEAIAGVTGTRASASVPTASGIGFYDSEIEVRGDLVNIEELNITFGADEVSLGTGGADAFYASMFENAVRQTRRTKRRGTSDRGGTA